MIFFLENQEYFKDFFGNPGTWRNKCLSFRHSRRQDTGRCITQPLAANSASNGEVIETLVIGPVKHDFIVLGQEEEWIH